MKKKGQKEKVLPTSFSKKMNAILGAPDNQSTREANIRQELSELRRHANGLGALFDVICRYSCGNPSVTLDPVTVSFLADTGRMQAINIHKNVNSIEGLLKISAL